MLKMDKEFKDWLNRNSYGNYKGIEITPQTEIVSYTYVISMLVISMRHSTRYYFKEAEKQKAFCAKMLCILCNLIFGWWGIPWGPIWVVKETVCDIGNQYTKYWGEIAGKPEEQGRDNGQRKPIPDERPKGKKINPKDLIIYILIGIAAAGILVYMDITGNV